MRVDGYVEVVKDDHYVALDTVESDRNALKIVNQRVIIKIFDDCRARQIVNIKLV